MIHERPNSLVIFCVGDTAATKKPIACEVRAVNGTISKKILTKTQKQT